MGHFKGGAFRLALESGRPIVPIVLAGTQKVISKGEAGFGKARVAYMSVLPPVETQGLGIEEENKLREKIEDLMREELKKRNRILERSRA
jgi:1-acyl-sn-glycerol-3-phosphate acyltransferase